MDKTIVFSANTAWYLFNFRKNTIAAFLRRGYEVVTIAPEDAFVEKLRNMGCRHIVLPIRPSGKNPFHEAYIFRLYLLHYRKLRPLIAFHFTIKPNLYGSLAARMMGVAYSNNISGLGSAFNSRGPLRMAVRLFYRLSLGKSKRVFFQNPSDFGYFLDHGIVTRKNAEVIPGSGVDLASFKPHHKDPSPVFTFVIACRILWEKGFAYLIEAMKGLKERNVRVQCLVFGFTDAMNSKYVPMEAIGEWERSGWIRYGGPLEDVREAYALADCVVLPSYYMEGVPKSLLEAAAMAKPIVTTDWTGCKETVKDGVNGYLCQARNAQSLMEAMLKMIRLDEADRRRLGEAGRRMVERDFNEESVIESYLRVLDA